MIRLPIARTGQQRAADGGGQKIEAKRGLPAFRHANELLKMARFAVRVRQIVKLGGAVGGT